MRNKDGLSPGDIHALSMLDATAQKALVTNKSVHNETLFFCAQEKIGTFNPAFNAVTHTDFSLAEAALKDTPGDTVLLPYLLKGSDEYSGFPMQCGSRLRKDATGTAIHPFMEALSANGMLPVGMTAMPEFGLLASGESLLYGPSKNPWLTSHSALGSSTGAAIAVATGMTPYAHASDAAGSIRMPASACGVVGFKPSAGFNLRARRFDMIDDYLCTDSLLARSVRDVIDATNFTRPPSLQKVTLTTEPVHVGVIRQGLGNVEASSAVSTALEEHIALLRSMPGVTVETCAAPYDLDALQKALQTLWCYLGGGIVDGVAAQGFTTSDVLEPWPHYLHQRRASLSDTALREAFHAIAVAKLQLEEFHRKVDIVLSPVVADLPPPLGFLAPDIDGETLWNRLFAFMAFTPIQNLLGAPGITLPVYQHQSGLPVGMLLSAAPAQDDRLLSFASQVEACAPAYAKWQPQGHQGE